MIRTRPMWSAAAWGVCLLVTALVHVPARGENPRCVKSGNTASPLSPAQRTRADQLLSVCEYDTTELGYARVCNLNDGRGYTAGWVGFVTSDGDLLTVVERYTRSRRQNRLAKYQETLRELAREGSGRTDHLGGFPKAWRKAAGDELFRKVQYQVGSEIYFDQSAAWWRGLGLQKAWSLAFLYDTIVQHGEGEADNDPDGFPALVQRTCAQMQGCPATTPSITEAAWMNAFVEQRRKTLLHAHNPETREEWRKSVGRIRVYTDIRATGNLDLNGPIRVRTDEHTADIP